MECRAKARCVVREPTVEVEVVAIVEATLSPHEHADCQAGNGKCEMRAVRIKKKYRQGILLLHH